MPGEAPKSVDRPHGLVNSAGTMKLDSGAAPFEIVSPRAWTAPAVFNSPHSGSNYSQEFLRQVRLSPKALRKSEDCYVDELFLGCVEYGAPMLLANAPRSFIDVNREPYELDPRMFTSELPGYANTTSPRVAGGLGTIPRVVAEGEEIYRGRLEFSDVKRRVDQIYLPYHRTLSALTGQVFSKVGQVMLFDCHSMPASATSHVVALRESVDIVLGDRFGVSCSADLTALVEEQLRHEGLKVVRNKPYAGGFITQNYGAPARGRHALQIEVNRSLYMHEESLVKRSDFTALQSALTRVVGNLLTELTHMFHPRQVAAE